MNKRRINSINISDKNNWDGLATKCPFSKKIQKAIAKAVDMYINEKLKSERQP